MKHYYLVVSMADDWDSWSKNSPNCCTNFKDAKQYAKELNSLTKKPHFIQRVAEGSNRRVTMYECWDNIIA